ncbi:MAG TPA: EAL domain-containing protein [Chromatiales bacterium]|nr:EAL domain-containing protein [Chromatiales bacterium]
MKSLSTRIAVVISSILIGLLLTVGSSVEHQLTQSIKSEDIAQTKTHARTMLASLQTLMLNGQGVLAREWLERMRREPGIVSIDVLRQDGAEAFTDTSTIEAVNRFLQQPRFSRQPVAPSHQAEGQELAQISRALAGNVVVDERQAAQLVIYMPIKAQLECLVCHGYDDSQMRGVLKLAVSTAGASEKIHAMRLNLWGMSTLVVVILALVLLFALRQSVFRPIASLRDALWKVGRGDRNVKLPVHRQDELGELSAVFNRMQQQLSATEARIGAVMNSVVETIIVIDDHGLIEQVNPAAEKLFGYREIELIGQSVAMLMSLNFRPEHERAIEQYLAEGVGLQSERNRESECLRKDGSVFPAEITISEMYVDDHCRFICIVRDVTERKEYIDAIEYQALHDALTGLPNRVLLIDRLQQGVRNAKRGQQTLALLLIDLDHFKEVNDTLGHHNGDIILKLSAERMATVLRGSDTVARLGGDEFAVLLPGTDQAHAEQIAEKVRGVLEQPCQLEGHTFYVGASIGIAIYPEHGDDDVMLMQHADVAMYVAKRGKFGHAVYKEEQNHSSLSQLSLMNELRAAIDNEELMLCYQPVIALSTGCISGVEALIRWQHPTKGLLYPDDFIPVSEQTGLIGPLTLWVFERAMSQSCEWSELGLELRVSVNLSARNLHDARFPGQVTELIEAGGVNAERLRLEITESALITDPEYTTSILNNLGAMGVHISIDDFGTGYSSLAYLKQLPIDEIKIDRSFVTSMLEDESDEVIVRSTIDLAHNIGMKVVAEGVEQQALYDKLLSLGCDAVQGFHMGRPMPPAGFLRWLKESPWGLNKK